MYDFFKWLWGTIPTWLPYVFSVSSLTISLLTVWLTQFRRGTLKMTRPTLICLKREQPSNLPKLFFRALLYSTASKGCGVEQLYAEISTDYGSYLFDFWGATEGRELTLGSGIHVGQTGVSANHHFNPRADAKEFLFVQGTYRVEVFARIVGTTRPKKLDEIRFEVNNLQAGALAQIMDLELYLYRDAKSGHYQSELRRNNEVFLTEPPKFPSWFDTSGDPRFEGRHQAL